MAGIQKSLLGALTAVSGSLVAGAHLKQQATIALDSARTALPQLEENVGKAQSAVTATKAQTESAKKTLENDPDSSEAFEAQNYLFGIKDPETGNYIQEPALNILTKQELAERRAQESLEAQRKRIRKLEQRRLF